MRMYNGRPRKKYVTGNIGSLAQDEVFVFGSNLDGFLGGGAARAAFNKFGAVWGKGGGQGFKGRVMPFLQCMADRTQLSHTLTSSLLSQRNILNSISM